MTSIIDPYVSSPDARVFALRGLPEEVRASLFAAYSRSARPLREVLAELLTTGDLRGTPTRESVGRSVREALLRGGLSAALPLDVNLRLEAALDELFPAETSPAVQRAAAFHAKWTVGYGHGCYDSETDVLTSAGWKPWTDVTEEDRFATLSAEGRVEYQPPTRLIRYQHSGRMYRAEMRGVDLLVTPDHRMYVCPTTTREGRKRETYRLIPATELGHTAHAYQKDGAWEPDALPSDLPGDVLGMLGFTIGDGHVDRGFARFRLHRERKIVWLRAITARLGWRLAEFGGDRYDVAVPAAFRKLFSEVYVERAEWREKRIPPHLLTTQSSPALRSLFDGLMQADGHRGKTGDCYDTTSATLGDQFQHLALLVGLAANLCYERAPGVGSYGKRVIRRYTVVTRDLRPTINKYAGQSGRTSWIEGWEGEVFCAEVPNHTLYVRRNGQPVWSGNSVAEHASVAVGVERCSILAAKAFEEASYGVAFTEQSTRYVNFGRESFVRAIGLPPERADLQSRYEAATGGLLAVYCEATDELAAYAAKTWPAATEVARRGWVLDITRAILPCASATRLGMTLNGRAARAMVRKHRVSALPEMRELAEELDAAVRSELPALAASATPEPGRAQRERGREYEAVGVSQRRFHCELHDPDAVRHHIRADLGVASGEATVRRYMTGRGATERPGRAFEMMPVKFELDVDYGAWRDIQRHRPFSAPPVVVSPWSAWQMPQIGLLSAATRSRVESAVETAQAVGQSLYVEGFPALAAYPLPLGTLVHVEIATNLRAVLQFIELRSRPSGHDSYRTVAWHLCDVVAHALPELAPYIRCDRTVRTFAR